MAVMKRNPWTSKANPGAEGLKMLSAAASQGFNSVRQGEPLPGRMKILAWGDTATVDGDVMRINAKTVELLPVTQRQMNWPHAHIDIEHATVPGSPLFKLYAQNGKFGAVLGWGTPVVVDGEGLFVDGIVWSPESKRAYEFPDLSGTVKTLADGTVVGLHSFAFCCHGKAEGVHAYSDIIQTEDQDPMDKLLLALLGLTATATEQEQTDRAAKLGAALQSLLGAGEDGMKAMSALMKMDTAKLTALAALDPAKLSALSQLSETDLKTKLTALSALGEGNGTALQTLVNRVGVVETELKTLGQDSTALRRSKILGDAASKGKQVPASWVEKYGHDLKLLSDLVDGLPEGVIPLGQTTVDGGTRQTTPASKAEKDVAAIFGRKPEDLKGL